MSETDDFKDGIGEIVKACPGCGSRSINGVCQCFDCVTGKQQVGFYCESCKERFPEPAYWQRVKEPN